MGQEERYRVAPFSHWRTAFQWTSRAKNWLSQETDAKELGDKEVFPL
jgi:hypothetical protein